MYPTPLFLFFPLLPVLSKADTRLVVVVVVRPASGWHQEARRTVCRPLPRCQLVRCPSLQVVEPSAMAIQQSTTALKRLSRYPHIQPTCRPDFLPAGSSELAAAFQPTIFACASSFFTYTVGWSKIQKKTGALTTLLSKSTPNSRATSVSLLQGHDVAFPIEDIRMPNTQVLRANVYHKFAAFSVSLRALRVASLPATGSPGQRNQGSGASVVGRVSPLAHPSLTNHFLEIFPYWALASPWLFGPVRRTVASGLRHLLCICPTLYSVSRF